MKAAASVCGPAWGYACLGVSTRITFDQHLIYILVNYGYWIKDFSFKSTISYIFIVLGTNKAYSITVELNLFYVQANHLLTK